MRTLGRALGVLCGLVPVVGVASAHGVGRASFAPPLPLWLLFLGAGATVAATAALVDVGDHRRDRTDTPRTLATLSPGFARALRLVGRAGFLLVVLVVLWHGLVGPRVPAENLATLVVWPLWLKGLGLVALVAGSPWRTLSPWETVYDGLSRLEGRELAVRAYPSWLAAWPAVVGFVLGVGVVENLTVLIRSPAGTTLLVAGYTLTMVLGGVVFGREWFARADALTVLYRLLGAVAPIRFEPTDVGGYTVYLRAPWRGCTAPVGDRSLVAFVVAALYTVSFDGFAATTTYQRLLFSLRESLALGPAVSIVVYLAGLAGFVASYLLAAAAVERLGAGESSRRGTARAFATTLVPIAGAYELAHNYPFVLANLGATATVLRDALATGTAVDLTAWLPVSAFWWSQVALIVGGHVVAVVAAHRVAAGRYETPTAARRAHLPLVVVMIGYTVLSLWIVSRPLI